MEMLKNKLMLIMIIFFIALIPNALSHLDAGEDKVIGEYLMDFSYSPKEPSIDDKVTMAFSLLNSTNQEVIEPESVWIRISSSKEVIFAGTLKPENGNAAFTYKFPHADNYVITSRFLDNKETIAETNFDIKIEEFVPVYYYILVVAVILIIIFIAMKFNALNKELKKIDKRI